MTLSQTLQRTTPLSQEEWRGLIEGRIKAMTDLIDDWSLRSITSMRYTPSLNGHGVSAPLSMRSPDVKLGQEMNSYEAFGMFFWANEEKRQIAVDSLYWPAHAGTLAYMWGITRAKRIVQGTVEFWLSMPPEPRSHYARYVNLEPATLDDVLAIPGMTCEVVWEQLNGEVLRNEAHYRTRLHRLQPLRDKVQEERRAYEECIDPLTTMRVI